MPLPTIIGPDEALTVDNLCIVLYGEPGVGKTSLACTAESPLLLDFDRGAHRAFGRGATIPITSWADVRDIRAEDLAKFQTLVVDTVGRQIEMLSDAVAADSPKNARSDGSLSLQGFGAMKVRYLRWLSSVRRLGLDIVLVAHEKITERNDTAYHDLDIQGASRTEVVKSGDAVGFLYASGNDRVLDFVPRDNHVAKHIGVEQIRWAAPGAEPGTLARLIAMMKDHVNAESEATQKAVALTTEYRERIASVETLEDVTALSAEIGKIDNTTVRNALRTSFRARLKELGLKWDRSAKAYVEEAA